MDKLPFVVIKNQKPYAIVIPYDAENTMIFGNDQTIANWDNGTPIKVPTTQELMPNFWQKIKNLLSREL